MITAAGFKEYAKMLFKNGTAEMVYFFVGLYMLITQAPHIIDIDAFRLLILIGVYLTFAGIAIRLSLSLFQFVVLYVGETVDKYNKKEWTLESSIRDSVLEVAEEGATKVYSSLIPTKTEKEAMLENLKELNGDITEQQPEIKEQIAELEAELANIK